MFQGKVYVVFEGRQPSVYFSWVDCEVQVTGYKGNVYKSFKSYEEAELEWVRYCTSKAGGPVYIDCSLCRHHHGASSSRNRIAQSLPRMGPSNSQFAPDTDSDIFILQYSMQRQLEQVCNSLRIPGPEYTLHEVKVINGVEFQRYNASLSGGSNGTLAVSLGRFAKDDYNAQEDVTAKLLRRLLAAMGKEIRDFNSYNVDLLESHVNKIMDEKLELEMEISMLNTQLGMLG